jgi:hypothetical protein
MAVLDKINIIDTSIDMMKEALSLPSSSSLEEVVASITNGGANEPTNIYRVESEEEKNSLTGMVEDDICIVYADEKVRSSGTTPLPYTVLYFPETINIQDVYGRVSSESSCNMGAGGVNANKVTFKVGPTYFTVTEVSSSEIIANYISSDGRIYTRTTERTSYDAGINLKPGLFQNLRSPLYYFIYMQNMTFGLYQYKENQWGHLAIGVDPNLYDVLDTVTIYTNEGFQTGTRNEKDYRKDYIYIQAEEPEDKTGIWVTLTENGTYPTAPYQAAPYITTSDLASLNRSKFSANALSRGIRTSSTTKVYQDNSTNFELSFASPNGSSYDYKDALVANDIMYAVFPRKTSSGSGNDASGYSLNFKTGEITKITSHPLFSRMTSSSGMLTFKIDEDNLMQRLVLDDDADNYYIVKYNISSNTWTYETLLKTTENTTSWYKAGNYMFFYSTTNKKCYKAPLSDLTSIEELNLPEDTYSSLWASNSGGNYYYTDSRGRIWSQGICYDGTTLERISPAGAVKIFTSSTYLNAPYEIDNILYLMSIDDRSYAITYHAYDMDTCARITNGTVTCNPDQEFSYGVTSLKIGQLLSDGTVCWCGGIAYSNSWYYESRDKQEINIKDIEFIPNGSPLKLQTGPLLLDNNRCEIAKSVYINVKDIAYSNLDKAYIGNGSKWNQIK